MQIILVPEQVELINEKIAYEKAKGISCDKSIIRDLERALENGIVINKFDNEKIDVGTKFSIIYEGDDEETVYILVENMIGCSTLNGFVSIHCNFGKKLSGRKSGESFSYQVDDLTFNGSISEIIPREEKDISEEEVPEISYSAIKKDCSNITNESDCIEAPLKKRKKKNLKIIPIDDRYIRSKPLYRRIAKRNHDYLGKLYAVRDTDPNAQKELEKYDSITASQVLLLKKEYQTLKDKIKFLEANYYDTSDAVERLKKVNDLIDNAPRVISRKDNKIGIGSRVDFVTLEKGVEKYFSVEVIGCAVSKENIKDHVEAISSLGQSLLGLECDQKFIYMKHERSIRGRVIGVTNMEVNDIREIDTGFSYKKEIKVAKQG